MMSQLSSEILTIKNGINFRDLGGIKTQDGRKIKPNRLFRSGDFNQITLDEQNFIAKELDLNIVLDYRDHIETQTRPDKLWHQVQYFNIPANPMSDDVTANLTKELASTNSLKKEFPNDFMIKLYQLLPFNNAAYQTLIKLLLNSDGKSIVQHCAIGKDRTGVGVALTLFALGVDEQTIMADYLLSDQLLTSFREKQLSHYQTYLTAQEIENRKQFFAAKPTYLQSAIDAIKNEYKTINNWLEHEYQLNESKRQTIQNYYLT
ncbi:tyrosine-protein phosphatase [Orbus sturtevantii]|uniref:tyrosine-protein phosphatase n=1 Tax=Orbus sturtevantii TaxID=3074109 RepID=UPI00370D4B6D